MSLLDLDDLFRDLMRAAGEGPDAAPVPDSGPRSGHDAPPAAETVPLVTVGLATAGVRGRLGGWVPSGPDVVFLLVFVGPRESEGSPAGYGLGWTLLACEAGSRCWSVSLTGHRAGAHAGQERAEAAAHELLARHGVRITGWHYGICTHPVIARAAVPSEDTGHAARPGRISG